jgi:hypothetical protein
MKRVLISTSFWEKKGEKILDILNMYVCVLNEIDDTIILTTLWHY